MWTLGWVVSLDNGLEKEFILLMVGGGGGASLVSHKDSQCFVHGLKIIFGCCTCFP